MSRDQQRPDLTNGGRERVLLPVTPTQERCWFLNKLRPGTPSLNVSVRWEVRGRFPAPVMEQAFRLLIERHEILRTRFVEIDGVPQQEVFESAPFKLVTVDLSMLPEEQRLKQMTQIGLTEAQAPFDLSKPALIRAVMVRLAEDQAFVMLTIHQSVFDGWSIKLIGREIGAIGQALMEGRAPDLPELPLQYGDYALWREECLKGGALEPEMAYWKQQLDGFPYFEIEPDKERPPERTPNSAMVNTDLPPEFGLALEAAGKKHGVSFFNFGCAILIALLHRYTGRTDISLGAQFAGREDVDLENLIGVFINNIVLRNKVDDDPTFSDLVARANETSRQGLIHQNMPFHKLVEMLNPPRDVQRTPLISVNVILQKAFMEDARYGEFELLGRPSPSPGALYDFTFQMVGRATHWRMTIEYNTDLFERETAEHLLALWQEIMAAVIADPSQRLSQLLPNLARRSLDKKFTRLAAIERALEEHPAVDEAVVLLRNGAENAAPYAYVTPAPNTVLPLESLPAVLLRHLNGKPDLTQLSNVCVLMSLPKKAGGDLDLAALPPPSKAALPPLSSEPTPNDIEAKLIEIWREHLGVAHVDRRSNFFELGGHSLLALRMVTAASSAFSSKIDVLALFRAPTLHQFAAHIATLRQPEQENWKIVTIQAGNARPPMIAINNTILYYSLAKQLGEGLPFIGVQNYQPDADAPDEVRSMEEIAADYVKLIREAQPHGPYTLIGLCVAGAIAYEAAQQLTAQGEEPPTLIMFDSWAPGHTQSLPWLMRQRRRVAEWLFYHHDRLKLLFRSEITLGNFLGSYKIVQRVAELAGKLGLIKPMPKSEALWRPGFEDYLLRARQAYRAKPYRGDVLIFRSDEFPKGEPLFDDEFGWTGLIGGRLHVTDVDGGHLTMCMGDNATVVARMIEAFIADKPAGGWGAR